MNKHVKGCIFSGVAVAGSIIAMLMLSSHGSDELTTMRATERSIANQIEAKSTEFETDYAKNQAKSKGLDYDIVTRNEDILSDLFETAFTWDSMLVYDKSRESLMERFGADNDFFAYFMVPDIKVSTQTGDILDSIDGLSSEDYLSDITINGRNMKLKSVSSHIINVIDDEYTYLCNVYFTSNDKNGYTGTGDVVCGVTINGDGELEKLMAWY